MKIRRSLLPHVCQQRRSFLAAGTAVGAILAFPQLALAGKLLGVASEVYVNGRRAFRGATIRPGDVVNTGRLSEAVFVVGEDAFMLRERSEMRLLESDSGSNRVAAGLRVITGGLLSAFGSGERKLLTSTATAGIRGTGTYVEVSSDLTYFCTCYGTVELADSSGTETRRNSAIHHEALMVHDKPQVGSVFEPAKKRNHYDEELVLLEALAGRRPPFMTG